MTRTLFALALLLTPLPALSGDRGEDIRAVISRQIAAFQANDLERAFGFASPMIREMFGTAENFGAMVRNGYPMVWRPSDVDMGALEELGGRPVQSVLLRDATGRLYIADYEMIEIGGEWRINGVRIRQAEDQGA